MKKKIKTGKGYKSLVLWWFIGAVSMVCVFLAATLWLAGVVYSELPKKAALDEGFEPVDLVVCLTGGRGRIRKAIELYDKGYGKMLYISGIDRNVQLGSILREIRWVGPIDESKVVLENISTNTIQNAEQVNLFVQEHHLSSLLLVTSVYHIRRAHYIFEKIIPRHVRIENTWYESEPFDYDDWWKNSTGVWVTVSEFFKFFFSYLRLTLIR